MPAPSLPGSDTNAASITAPQRTVIERIPYDADAWEAIVQHHPDAEVFHSAAWLAFLHAAHGAEPVVAIVRSGGRPVGYFVGALVRRLGVRILGSPLRGWGTEYMGFLLEDGADRRAAADALIPFAFGDLGCLHVELADRRLTRDEMAGSSYAMDVGTTYLIDLTPSEEELVARMHENTRKYIRRAPKRGLRPELATDPGFADEFHEQLVEVFGRQRLVPTYDARRVRLLIEALLPTGQVLLVRMRSPEDRTVSTMVSVGRNRTAVAWGAAFFRSEAALHPNEPMWWETIRHWRARGATLLDMGGAGDYKRKFGSTQTEVLRFHRSRFAMLRHGRSLLRRLYAARQATRGRLASRGARPKPPPTAESSEGA